MRVTLLALGLLCLRSLASPLFDHDVGSIDDPQPRLDRRQLPTVAITGIQEFGVHPRLEIRQLEQNADQWNIFLLGLQLFQETDQSQVTSYYQIAGIHGRPYEAWDNVPPASGVENPNGYCNHVITTFLPWHRAYTLLFEQQLYQSIIAAVNSFPPGSQRQQYASAALSWRLPYYDWALTPSSGQPAFPTSLSSPTINVTMANGTNTIPNPLYSYTFHPVVSSDFYYEPFATWPEVMRSPTNWSQNAVQQDSVVAEIFENNYYSLQERLYNLFTSYSNFTEFGNEAWIGSGETADSLESVHDVVHGMLGNNGHMTYFDYSAYDPVFWLHHSMIDRCFALWQALYPNSYVEPMQAVEQSFAIAIGQTVDAGSPLEPFFSDQARDYWTPSSIQSISNLGYTYPELANGANVSSIKAAINSLYGNNAGGSSKARRKAKRELDDVSHVDADAVPDEVVDGAFNQYIANIVSLKSALNGSYAVYIFLGSFNDTPAAWPTAPNLVGTHVVFAGLSNVDASSNPIDSQPQKTKRDSPSVQVSGSIPLTSMLLQNVQDGELADMSREVVSDYLNKNLAWRVGMFDGTQIDDTDLAGLMVMVVSAEVEPAANSDEFPTWSNYTTLTNITQGKPGGC